MYFTSPASPQRCPLISASPHHAPNSCLPPGSVDGCVDRCGTGRTTAVSVILVTISSWFGPREPGFLRSRRTHRRTRVRRRSWIAPERVRLHRARIPVPRRSKAKKIARSLSRSQERISHQQKRIAVEVLQPPNDRLIHHVLGYGQNRTAHRRRHQADKPCLVPGAAGLAPRTTGGRPDALPPTHR